MIARSLRSFAFAALVLAAPALAMAQVPPPPPADLAPGGSTGIAAVPAAPTIVIPAPPPDIAQTFRTEIAAITGTGSARRAVLARTTEYGRVLRRLKVGDLYQDGWVVSSITSTSVVLRNGAERRTIDLTADPVSDKPVVEQRSVIKLGSLGVLPPPPPPEEAPAVDPQAAPAPAVDAQALVQALRLLTAPIE